MPGLVRYIREALDSLKIPRAILIGHSFGAREAAAFAIAFPDRVSHVIYLDGAYNFSPEVVELSNQLDSFAPHPSARESASVSALFEWNRKHKVGWNSACETDFLATHQTASGEISLTGSTPAYVF